MMRIHYLFMKIAVIFAAAGIWLLPGAHAMGTRPQSAGALGTGQIVSTAGIRGLDEEQLKAAKYDAVQISELDSQAVSAAAARNFAAQAGLRSRPIAYLPDPARGNSLYP